MTKLRAFIRYAYDYTSNITDPETPRKERRFRAVIHVNNAVPPSHRICNGR